MVTRLLLQNVKMATTRGSLKLDGVAAGSNGHSVALDVAMEDW